MGYIINKKGINTVLEGLSKKYLLYGPVRYKGEGQYSNTDSIRYGEIKTIDDLELEAKSQFSFKEIVLPISETLLYFTEDEMREAKLAHTKEVLVFARSCDIHAIQRLDAIYLQSKYKDYYYARLREKIHFVLIGCQSAFENCFCVDMETNRTEDYLFSLDKREDRFYTNVKEEILQALFALYAEREEAIEPDFVTETDKKVKRPKQIDANHITNSDMWREYDARCISCGRCNFSCPTCTCYTMQDIFYQDNPKNGERRRIHASCMVDGFTNVSGGGQYRVKKGDRMRFRVLHKIYDFRARYQFDMCVGCGRCDDVCPEYISFSSAVNKVSELMEKSTEEVS